MHPIQKFTIAFAVIACLVAAYMLAPKFFSSFRTEVRHRNKRPEMLPTLVEKLEKTRKTCKPANNDKPGAREFIYDLGNNMFVRHEIHPQQHAIIMWDVNGTHVDMRLDLDGNIVDHLAVNDDDLRSARRILVIMKAEEKKYTG